DIVIKYPQHVYAIGSECDSLLAVAPSRRHFSIVELLLEHSGNVNFHGTNGHPPLHSPLDFLKYKGKYRDNSVWFLLKRGTDINTQDMSKFHEALLHLVVRENHSTDIIRVLLEHGANPNLENRDGQTPLHVQLAELSPELLLEHGTNSNLENEDGRTPLSMLLVPEEIHSGYTCHYHCANNNTCADKDGNTPLHYTSKNGMFAITQVLLEHGGKPNAKGKDGKTSLHLTLQDEDDSEEGDICIMQLLLEHGADVDAQDNSHVTPLDLSSHLQKCNVQAMHIARLEHRGMMVRLTSV
ncbi:ankyrin repeat-containing domain protein, partial [Lactarius quietus]